jgi:hypothetical protein
MEPEHWRGYFQRQHGPAAIWQWKLLWHPRGSGRRLNSGEQGGRWSSTRRHARWQRCCGWRHVRGWRHARRWRGGWRHVRWWRHARRWRRSGWRGAGRCWRRSRSLRLRDAIILHDHRRNSQSFYIFAVGRRRVALFLGALSSPEPMAGKPALPAPEHLESNQTSEIETNAPLVEALHPYPA